MSPIARDIRAFLAAEGFTIVRTKNHLIWRNARGQQLVTAVSPSDWRAFRKVECDVAKLRREAAEEQGA